MNAKVNEVIASNPSGLRPLGVAVLVEPYEPEAKKSVIALPESVGDKHKMTEVRAIVVAIGPDAWKDEPRPRAAIGDKVMISRMSGVFLVGPLDGKKYRMINAQDIYALIEREAK